MFNNKKNPLTNTNHSHIIQQIIQTFVNNMQVSEEPNNSRLNQGFTNKTNYS